MTRLAKGAPRRVATRIWLAVLLVYVGWSVVSAATASPPQWPTGGNECKPWLRWFWMGSAVDAPELTRHLEQYAAAGIGGVEIYPVYGVRGAEDRSLEFLSPAWMRALDTRLPKRGGWEWVWT